MAVVRFGNRPTLGLRPSQLRDPRGPSGRPVAPTSLAITGASAGIVADLTPEATADAVAGATGYDFEVALSSTGLTGTATVTNQPTPAYTFSTLLNLTSYVFAIRARNAAGPGPWSAGVTVTTRVTLVDEHFASGLGVLSEIDTNNRLSVSGGVLNIANHSDNTFSNALVVYSAGLARVAGRAMLIKHFSNASNRALGLGFSISDTAFTQTTGAPITLGFRSSKSIDAAFTEFAVTTETDNTAYQFAVVLMETGQILCAKGGQYTNWTPFWFDIVGTNTPVYPMVGAYAAAATGMYFDDFVVLDLPNTFPQSFSDFTLNVASPSAADYTATADQVINLTLTAPGTITTEAGIIFRKTDANNYWRAFFDTAGAFKVEKVVSGSVASTPINVAGIITGGATRTIQIVMYGSRIDVATNDGTKSLRRGSSITDSHAATATTARPDIGSGWTAANLRSLAGSDPDYAMLDVAIGS